MVTGTPLGFKEPEQLRLGGKWYVDPETYKFDFSTWVVNTDAVVADVSQGSITITKFKPNTWLLHSEAIAGQAEQYMCSKCAGFTLSWSGVSANSSLFATEVNMTNNHGAGSDIPHFRGLEIFPGVLEGTNWFWMQERMYTWEAIWDTATTRNISAIADNDSFKGNVGGHGRYGYGSDLTNRVVFPANVYDIPTWNRGLNTDPETTNTTWYCGIGLYGANIETDSDGWVTLSTPIKIWQTPKKGICPTDSMCFDAYCQGESVYHKPRTVQNTWGCLGMLETKTDPLTGGTKTFVNGIDEIGSLLTLNVPVDLEDYMYRLDESGSYKSCLAWRCKVYNSDFWDSVKSWYANNSITDTVLVGLFKDSNVNGDVTVRLKSTHNAMDEAFMQSDVESVTIKNTSGNSNSVFGSGHRAFSCASKLKSVSSEIYFVDRDLSGMFERCTALTTYPVDLIHWGSWTGYINFGWFCEMSGMTTIPSYNQSNRFASNNEIKPSSMQQSFNFCSKLTSIGPVINMIAVEPDTLSSYNTFNGCTALTDVRIKNLNHGDWHFDGSVTGNDSGYHGTLEALDSASVAYLLENLVDLTTHSDEDSRDSNGIRTNPKVSSATIYCPSAWKSKVSSTQIAAAKAKGWTLSGLS